LTIPPGDLALDSNIAIRFLNGDMAIVDRVTTYPTIILPLVVVGEPLFGAKNSDRAVKNLTNYYRFIDICLILPMNKQTAIHYSNIRFILKQKGRPIPENDIWIAAQCIEYGWTLVSNDKHFQYINDLRVIQW